MPTSLRWYTVNEPGGRVAHCVRSDNYRIKVKFFPRRGWWVFTQADGDYNMRPVPKSFLSERGAKAWVERWLALELRRLKALRGGLGVGGPRQRGLEG